MPAFPVRGGTGEKVATLLRLATAAFALAAIDGTSAFAGNRFRLPGRPPLRPPALSLDSGGADPAAGYESLDPDASPGSFHTPSLRSAYPQETPAGLRGEAVRSALVTTERCIGWNLSSNEETSMGGLLEISGRGTIEFLNGKLTRDFRRCVDHKHKNAYLEAGLLDAKGRLVDVLRVVMVDDNRRALVLTSPGHSSADLTKRLDPFVFPMDEVTLTNFCTGDGEPKGGDDHRSFVFTLASTRYEHVRRAVRDQAGLPLAKSDMVFPASGSEGVVWNTQQGVEILVLPSTGLPSMACVGYTFVLFGSGPAAAAMGREAWGRLTGEDNPEGPVEVGALEYETLRIEAGTPAYGHEFGIDREKTAASAAASGDDKGQTRTKGRGAGPAKASIKTTGPYELHLDTLVDLDKGCYLGQEGVASVLKNPRGPPRSLYTVVFEDEFNVYEPQSRGDTASTVENLTELPRPGQTLYALGSNGELKVGTLTSVGEAGGTGSRFTAGLALVRRAGSIRKKMDALGLEIPRDTGDYSSVDPSGASGIVQPPPMDPLDGLEVIIEGTFTVGILNGIPSRKSGRFSNMFDADIEVEGIEEESEPPPASVVATPPRTEAPQESYGVTDDVDDEDDEESLERIESEMAKAAAEAETAAAEAKRKADKMEALKQRAEAAMARRKQKEDETREAENAAAAEAERKAEKMALLKQRAEEAMARRKQNKALASEENKEPKEDPAAAEARRKAEKMEMLKKRAEEAMARRRQKKKEE